MGEPEHRRPRVRGDELQPRGRGHTCDVDAQVVVDGVHVLRTTADQGEQQAQPTNNYLRREHCVQTSCCAALVCIEGQWKEHRVHNGVRQQQTNKMLYVLLQEVAVASHIQSDAIRQRDIARACTSRVTWGKRRGGGAQSEARLYPTKQIVTGAQQPTARTVNGDAPLEGVQPGALGHHCVRQVLRQVEVHGVPPLEHKTARHAAQHSTAQHSTQNET